MLHTETLHSIVYASTNPDIVKKISIASLFISFSMFLVGLLAFAVTFSFDDKSSTASMGLMVLGTALFLIGIFRLFWKSKQIVYVPTGSTAKQITTYFDLKYLSSLQEMLSSGSVPSHFDFTAGSSGNVRMDILYSADEKFAAVQLFQFIPYNYEPVTAVNYFKNDDARNLLSILKNK